MNKKERTELAALAKRFGNKLPGKYDEWDCDQYSWGKFGDQFFDWLCAQKHSFDMERILNIIIRFHDTLPDGCHHAGDDWDEPWRSDKSLWYEFTQKLIHFCQHD